MEYGGGHSMAIKDLADRIREHIKANHVAAARKEGKKTLRLKAKDIHQQLGLEEVDYPTVCDVLSSPAFAEACQIRHIRTEGPRLAPETTYVYQMGDLV
jgi:hypothetical protein